VNHLKFLYDAFLPKYYWTEVMECLRKLLLTGFVVFFYEGSALQLLVGMIISIIFFGLYAFLHPYLMPSNNTFATFVHLQVTLTLSISFGLKMFEFSSKDHKENLQFSTTSLSYALLLSNGSVLFVGLIFIMSHLLRVSNSDIELFTSSTKSKIDHNSNLVKDQN